MAYAVRFDHHVEIDGVPLSTAAWEHLNIGDLYSAPNTRGDNRVLPGAYGQRALPWRPDATTRSLDMVVFGDTNWDGTPNADPIEGLYTNLAHLMTFVVDPPAAPDGTRQAVIKRAGTDDLTATIQVRGFEVTDHYGPSNLAFTMDVTLMAGRFA